MHGFPRFPGQTPFNAKVSMLRCLKRYIYICFTLSSGKLREDLFKKFASADGIAGRKPYGFKTHMIHCIGWKRLEANRMFHFDDVDARNFNAILRRSFVWRVKARFEDPHVIAEAYEDIHKDGVFPKDPDLAVFLTSPPAVGAGLQIQHAFEAEYSKQDCVNMIENCHMGRRWWADRKHNESCLQAAAKRCSGSWKQGCGGDGC